MTRSNNTSKGQTTLPATIRSKPGALEVFGSLKPSTGKAGASYQEERAQSRETWVAEKARKNAR
jgi:hypothetical protein